MAAFHALARRAILSLAANPAVRRVALKHGMKLGASRFVAGETLDQALQVVADLNRQGIEATLDHLGEFVSDAAEARAAAEVCLATLDGIHRTGVKSHLSVKLTQLGLDIDLDLCRENMRRILSRAREYGNFVRIDMEDSPRTDRTLALFRELFQEFGPRHVGIVLQSYLYRTDQDLQEMARLGANVRLVKGAYMEPPSVAYPSKADVDRKYIEHIRQYLASGCYTAIATHDERAIRAAQAFAAERGIPRDRFEFQMLYGIRRERQRQLAQEGYRVRVYVPYGRDWYGYFTRRIAERPANLWFVLSNLFRA